MAAALIAGPCVPYPGRVSLLDLLPADGLPSERYKNAVCILAKSLARFNCAIIQLSPAEDALLSCVLDSARMYFHHKPIPGLESLHPGDSQDWTRSAGYCAEPHHLREVYDFRPGRSSDASAAELPPVGLSELFSALGRTSRHILHAIASSLDLQSFCFTDLLDNMPLKNGEVSTSVLSACCHGRPGVTVAGGQQGHIPIFEDHEPHADKGLITLVKSDKPGLHIRDAQGHWLLADADLGFQDVVMYSGLALYQATAGYVMPALHRTEAGAVHGHIYGRCSLAFKLMPRPSAILHCSAMTTAGYAVCGPFQQPIAVHDFMQRPHPMDHIICRPVLASFTFSSIPNAAVKSVLKRRRQVSSGKPLAPSKKLRQEAQRVLKRRVQEIADRKGIKIRFCSLKECEEQHLTNLDSPCAAVRSQIGWPQGVPFVHPHDLPNKAKQAFLEAYEPGWSSSQNGQLVLVESVPGTTIVSTSQNGQQQP